MADEYALKLSVSMPADLVREVDAEAENDDRTRSAMITRLCREALEGRRASCTSD